MAHNLDFIFQVENVLPGNTGKNVKYIHYSTSFHQVFIKLIAQCSAI